MNIFDENLDSPKGGTFSVATVYELDDLGAWQRCATLNCVLAYMKKSGASEESMNFTKKIHEEDLGEGFLETFEEKGRVDLGLVFFPSRANTNEAYVLLNGKPSLVSTELAWHGRYALDISRDSNYSRLKKQYPGLRVWPSSARFISADAGIGGGQRFIFTYFLVDYCHACSVGWQALVAFDFSRDGTFKGTKVLKLITENQIVDAKSSWAPSFDCAKANTGPERMICSNKELAEADVRMVQLYQAARNNLPNKEALRREQKNWLKNIRDACVETTCLLRAYKDRIAQLSRIIIGQDK